MPPTLQPNSMTPLHQSPPLENQTHMGSDVAHELNNILTIIRGYAERMLIKHRDNPALRQELQLITTNTRRAENVVRQATQHHRSPQHPVAA